MNILGLNDQEIWVSIITISLVGFFYLLRDQLDEWQEDDAQPQWRWGDKARRSRKPASWWASHLMLAPLTLFATVFAIGVLRRI